MQENNAEENAVVVEEAKEPVFKIFDRSVEVIVRGKKFVFDIPTVRQSARVAQRAKAIRMQDGGGDGSEAGLSWYEIVVYRAIANIEVLLTSSDDASFFSEDPKTKAPVVDSSKWPASISEDYILEVYDGFLAAINSFRTGSTKQ